MKNLFLILALSVSIQACSRDSEKPASLPELSEIKDITIIVHQTSDGKIPKKDQFTISKDFGKVLQALSPNVIDTKPAKWESGGIITINTLDGKAVKISFYWPRKEPLAIKVDGKYYRGGSIKALSNIIDENMLPDKQQTKQEKASENIKPKTKLKNMKEEVPKKRALNKKAFQVISALESKSRNSTYLALKALSMNGFKTPEIDYMKPYAEAEPKLKTLIKSLQKLSEEKRAEFDKSMNFYRSIHSPMGPPGSESEGWES